mgnify:CR=1 FL=1
MLFRSHKSEDPWYIRIGKGDEPLFSSDKQHQPNEPKFFGDTDAEILFLTTGVVIHEIIEAIKILNESGILGIAAIHFSELTCISFETWKDRYLLAQRVIVAEEHIPRGGLFSRILHTVHSEKLDTRKLEQISLPFNYIHNYGSQREHFIAQGLDALSLAKKVK